MAFWNKKPKRAPLQMTVSEGLDALRTIGVEPLPEFSTADIAAMIDSAACDEVENSHLLCLLGDDIDFHDSRYISDDIWHLDTECIENDGDYARLVDRFVSLTKGALCIKEIRDSVDFEAGRAWVAFTLANERFQWNFKLVDDWMDQSLYTNMQSLMKTQPNGKRFQIAVLGQDVLIAFGDETKRQALSRFSGYQFEWE